MARVYGWATPEVIDKMFGDEIDYHGLVFWYNDAREQDDNLKKATKDKK